MRELTWKRNKAKIWFEDLPDWSYKVIQIVEWNLRASNMPDRRFRGAAVEMMVPSGSMAMYGTLGATFIPEQRVDLQIQILVSDNGGPLLRDTLALKGEVAHIGFPQEYITGVRVNLTAIMLAVIRHVTNKAAIETNQKESFEFDCSFFNVSNFELPRQLLCPLRSFFLFSIRFYRTTVEIVLVCGVL